MIHRNLMSGVVVINVVVVVGGGPPLGFFDGVK